MRRFTAIIALISLVLLAGCDGCRNNPDARGVSKWEAHFPPLENADVVPQLEPKEPPITFFVTADTHLGSKQADKENPRMVAAMNSLPGQPYPWGVSGKVAQPAGVLIAGDLTENGLSEQLDEFIRLYGLTGRDGVLKYPVFETAGNHDWDVPVQSDIRIVPSVVRKRHGGLAYAWEWGGVRMICLGIYPNEKTCSWLALRLAEVGKDKPVVLYLHYSFQGPYSDSWNDSEKKRFAETIAGYNIIAIFHGHYHPSQRYKWEGCDIYNVGSCKHNQTSFCVVRIENGELTVASWNWNTRGWEWSHKKPLKR